MDYEEKIEALKIKMLEKIQVYKNIYKMRIAKNEDNINKYIIEYHYLIILEDYLKKEDAFNEKNLENNKKIDEQILDILLYEEGDPVFVYLLYMTSKYKCIDILEIFNNEISL